MKKLFILLCITFITGCAGTFEGEMLGMMGVRSFQNEPEGFRGLKWGQDLSEVQGLHQVYQDDEGLTIYERDGDQLLLGDAELKSVRYLFWKGKFMEANMAATTGQLQALKNVLTEKYGSGYNPFGPFSTIHDYSWSGPVAYIHSRRITFMSDCELSIRSREISEQRNIYRVQKAKAGAERGARRDF